LQHFVIEDDHPPIGHADRALGPQHGIRSRHALLRRARQRGEVTLRQWDVDQQAGRGHPAVAVGEVVEHAGDPGEDRRRTRVDARPAAARSLPTTLRDTATPTDGWRAASN
jgi:hypothetical protein